MKSIIQVFISYSHDSCEQKSHVLSFANQLRLHGIDCVLDQYDSAPEEGWPKWMEKQIYECQYTLIVCTKAYYEKFSSEIIGGKGVKWEGAIITQVLYDSEGMNNKFVPIVVQSEHIKWIPKILKPYTYYDISTRTGYEDLYRRLTDQPKTPAPELGRVITFPLDNVIPFPSKLPVSRSGVRPTVNKILPPIGAIGANALLKTSIERRFNRLGDERSKRFGKSAYSVMYKNFKTDFGIKELSWTTIWGWPESAADEIIGYLDDKYQNTIDGRVKGAIERGTLIPSKSYLFGEEKDLLSSLGLESSSPDVRDTLAKYFGVSSRAQMTKLDLWLWVKHLKALAEKKLS